jgi:hypothetical protein
MHSTSKFEQVSSQVLKTNLKLCLLKKKSSRTHKDLKKKVGPIFSPQTP